MLPRQPSHPPITVPTTRPSASAKRRTAVGSARSRVKPSRVSVALEKIGRILEISIDDNGVGFHFSGAYTLDELDLLRMGPLSLKRRARSLGAELLLESRPGHGAGLKMKVPI